MGRNKLGAWGAHTHALAGNNKNSFEVGARSRPRAEPFPPPAMPRAIELRRRRAGEIAYLLAVHVLRRSARALLQAHLVSVTHLCLSVSGSGN